MIVTKEQLIELLKENQWHHHGNGLFSNRVIGASFDLSPGWGNNNDVILGVVMNQIIGIVRDKAREQGKQMGKKSAQKTMREALGL